jgi:hypothetical protein
MDFLAIGDARKMMKSDGRKVNGAVTKLHCLDFIPAAKFRHG